MITMTQEVVEDTIMNDAEENRKSISLTAIKNENEFSNNNETNKCKQTEFEQSESKLSRNSDTFVKDLTSNAAKDISENCDFENSNDSDSISTLDKDSDNPLTMNLRTFRRATMKKQILDNMSKCTNKVQTKCQGKDSLIDSKTINSDSIIHETKRKRKLSESNDADHPVPVIKVKIVSSEPASYDKTQQVQNLSTSCPVTIKKTIELKPSEDELDKEAEEKEYINDEHRTTHKRTRNITEDNSENSSMTLQQFTDIVLASEGMSMPKDRKKLSSPEQASSATPSTPHRKNSLQSSCGGDDEASNSSPTIFSSEMDRKVSIELNDKQALSDNSMVISSTLQKPQNSSNGVKLEQFDNGYNNNIVDSTTHNAMVANIMNNKDLTVEVKPINVKPVVLSPRHPNGYNHHFQNKPTTKEFKEIEINNSSNNPWYSKSRQHSLASNGRLYPLHPSRTHQRYDSDNSSCSGDNIDSKMSPLPKGRPPSVPKMVEEWLQKMQPPPPEEEDPHYEGSIDVPISNDKSVDNSTTHSVPRKHQLILRDPQEMKSSSTNFKTECDSNTVLNLSTKDYSSKSHSNLDQEKLPTEHKLHQKGDSDINDVNSDSTGKPTQVYLRPIPTNKMIENPPPSEPKSHLPTQGKQQILALNESGLKPRRPEYEQIVILGRHARNDQYIAEQNRRYYNPVNGSRGLMTNGNLDYYSKRLSTSSMNVRTVNQNLDLHKSRHLQSSPNLEIRRIAPYSKNLRHEPPSQMHPKIDRINRNIGDFNVPSSTVPNTKSFGRVFPLDSSNRNHENIKARAMRDITLAHTKDVHGNYPIHMAVLMRKPELVKRYSCVLQILESTIDLQNDDKLTPLHLAIRDNSLEIIELLLAFGADPALRDNKGNSGLHVAAALGASACLQLLAGNTKQKEDLNELNDCGITPLQISMMNSDKISTDILIRSGANLKLVDPKLLKSKHGSLLPLGTANNKQ